MMWMILQHDKAEDWVIATGKTYTVREFILLSFKYVGIKIEFKGSGVDEKGYVISSNNKKYNLKVGQEVVSVNSAYYRPTEVDLLIGNPSKAKEKLGWESKTSIDKLVQDMMSYDLKLAEKEKFINDNN